ncbi:MAG: S8 family serine peptidase, partial [Candidatus Parabeggiatoa sp.]|nr:S8 family serine peptidase [Candidatus Parabeggiatoa sp.]
MKFKHRSTWFLSRLLAVILLLGTNPTWAQPTIPQDLLDMIAEQGSARVIVGLDIPWQPEGLLSPIDVAGQRRIITNTQSQFVETLSQDLADDGLIDSPHSPDGTPTVKAARTFETVPYLVFEVNSVTLPYVQNTPDANTLQLSVPDEPTMSESLPLIGADKAWDSGHTGAGQAIAIIDTGVDNTHTAFAPNRIIAEACFSVTHCPNGEKAQTRQLGAAQPCEFDPDGCGHGTHVAGIAAGTAPEAQIIAVQAASEFFGKASFYRDDQIAALDWLHANRETFGVPLAAINMSVGGQKSHSQPCDEDARAKIIQNLDSVGIATIISAGNNGYADGISAPACITKAISVGATDKTGQLWPQSNRAGILDLLAPGVGIESALPGDLMGAKDGTSMAAPHVAGAWAILKAAHPDASIAEILAMLKNTGQDVNGTPLIQLDAAIPKTGCNLIPDGLVACYPFDGNANDESGNGNHGTVKGGATLTTDRLGNANSAYRLDGINGYIEAADSPTLNVGTGDYSMAIWVRYEGSGQLDFWSIEGVLIDKREPVNAKGFSLYFFGPGQIGTQIADNGKYHFGNFNEKAVLEDAQWHHVVATVERKSTTGLKLYLDGKVITTRDPTALAGSLDSPGTFKVGHSYAYQPYSVHGFLNGSVDDVRLYNRALSESEIQTLYGSEKATLTLTKTGEGEITSPDNSINCGESCEADYKVDSTVTLTATPATGYSFTGWSGDCSGTFATTTVTMNAAKSCVATFEKQNPTSCTRWNLVENFLTSPNQGNPNPDSCGNQDVWHFMEG